MDKETILDLISNIVNDENVEAKSDFESIISQKLSAALDAKKIEVAQSIYSSDEEGDVGDDSTTAEYQEQDPEDAIQ